MRVLSWCMLLAIPMFVASTVSADELVLIEQTRKGDFKILDQDQSGGNSMGDVELWSAAASDPEGKDIGKSSGHCLYVSGTHKHCTWSLNTEAGNLVFIGFVDDTKAERAYTVVGGDGRYAGASGSMMAIDKYEKDGIYEMRIHLAK